MAAVQDYSFFARPIGEARVLGSRFHEGMVQRHVGDVAQSGFAAQLDGAAHGVALEFGMHRVAGIQLARDPYGLFGLSEG
jgi:hypothetical protein